MCKGNEINPIPQIHHFIGKAKCPFLQRKNAYFASQKCPFRKPKVPILQAKSACFAKRLLCGALTASNSPAAESLPATSQHAQTILCFFINTLLVYIQNMCYLCRTNTKNFTYKT